MHTELMRALTTNYDEVVASGYAKELAFKENFSDITIPDFTTEETIRKLYDVLMANKDTKHYLAPAHAMVFEKVGDYIQIGVEKIFFKKKEIDHDGQKHFVSHGHYVAHEGCDPMRYKKEVSAPVAADKRYRDSKCFMENIYIRGIHTAAQRHLSNSTERAQLTR